MSIEKRRIIVSKSPNLYFSKKNYKLVGLIRVYRLSPALNENICCAYNWLNLT